jgi:DNA repair photolyase
MKRPHLITGDEEAVGKLTSHWAFRPSITPIQLLNRATDPFLPGVKDHLFETLEELDRRGYDNMVLVITRWHIEPEDVARLERLRYVRLTILVTWSGIDDARIEPVDSSIAERSLALLGVQAKRTKCILYWRPIVAGLNDTDDHIRRALSLSPHADATVFTGLFYRQQIREYFRQAGVSDLYPEIARRKILPRKAEERILASFADRPLFRKTSCGVAFAHGRADYNGHYCIREVCDICPVAQLALCASSHRQPDIEDVRHLADLANLDSRTISVDGRRVEVAGSTEQQRYFMQHTLNFQVHDREHPHIRHQHGRAELGWT